MISFSPARLVLAVVALTAALLCVSCAGETMSVSAANCWGNGSGDCREAKGQVLRALGYQGAGLSALVSDLRCDAVVDCSALAKATRKRPARRSPSAAAPSRVASGSEASTHTEPAAESAVQAEPSAANSGRVEPSEDSGAATTAAPVVTPRAPAAEDAAEAEQAAVAPQGESAPAQQNTEKLAAVSGSSGSCSGIDIACSSWG